MKALVTGGTGFIGGHVVDLLLEGGHAVRILSRRPELPERLRGKSIEHIQADFNDPFSVIDAMQDIDVFFHIGEIKNTSMSASRKNITLMETIVSSRAVRRIGRLVFVSSITVAGIPAKVPACEDTMPETILNDQYTYYKRTCEGLIAGNLSDAEYAIIRPAIVYGPRSINLRNIASALARTGIIGIPFSGAGRNCAPFIHVKDLAQAIYRAAVKSGAVQQTFNITDGLPHTWREFFDAIGEAKGRRLKVIPVPPFYLKGPAAFLDCLIPPFGIRPDLGKYISYFSRDIYFKNRKARDILEWEALHTDLKRGIAEMMTLSTTDAE